MPRKTKAKPRHGGKMRSRQPDPWAPPAKGESIAGAPPRANQPRKSGKAGM